MNAKTKKTLTVIAVGALAFFGARYLFQDKSNGNSEKKSNAVGDCGCGG